MTLVRIADFDDRRLDPYRHLKKTNETARRGLFIAEGEKLVGRLLESGLAVESVLLGEKFVDTLSPMLPSNATALVIPDEWVEQLVGFNFHRGVLACGHRPASPRLDDLLSPIETNRILAVCPDVQDPENLGAIIRIARAFGVDGLVLGPRCADPFSRRVQRVSMGNVYRLPVFFTPNVVATLGELRSRYAMASWATVLDPTATELGTARRPPRVAVVFGSEGHGLAVDVVAACDQRVTIPMRPGVDSLNVAVAAGILLHGLAQT